MNTNNHLKIGSIAALLLASSSSYADIVHLDDVIINQSLCVGNDCVNGESFGFDTIRLKENNNRIKSDDTSNSASFPQNDWQLTFNDSNNGGKNKFSIDDVTAGRAPFTIEAGAPAHTLYVEDGGRIGFGTATPVVNLHVKEGNSPTLRLEQDGSSGFTPQTWDLAGNEANFFIRDVTNGSKLPFKIKPSAPTSSIFVAADGDIGLGTEAPNGPLHIKENGATYLTLENSAVNKIWYVTHENNAPNDLLLTQEVAGVGQGGAFRLTGGGNLTISGTLTTGAGNSCNSGCDRVFAEDYEMPTIEQHAKEMWENQHLPAVGATDENGPMNITEKTGRILNELEKAHIYIEQLHERLKKLEK